MKAGGTLPVKKDFSTREKEWEGGGFKRHNLFYIMHITGIECTRDVVDDADGYEARAQGLSMGGGGGGRGEDVETGASRRGRGWSRFFLSNRLPSLPWTRVSSARLYR